MNTTGNQAPAERTSMSDLGDEFIRRGFVRIDHAVPTELADTCRDLLWARSGCDRDDPSTWTRPVVRLGNQSDPEFVRAGNTDRLTAAYDALVGSGRWLPPPDLGTFPIRFPSAEPPGDDGWHVDASFPGDDPTDYFSWRVNLASRGRALLMLFLFSDVGTDDAPTRIRVGSHLEVARILARFDADGMTMVEISRRATGATEHHDVALATGNAGDVYLCHPFLVHAAQPHRGAEPKFMAQPPLLPVGELDPASGTTPVEVAIRLGLTGSPDQYRLDRRP